MRFLLFNHENVTPDEKYDSDLSEITDEDFEAYANEEGGFIYEDFDDFQSAFNGEQFSTATHQLRIIE